MSTEHTIALYDVQCNLNPPAWSPTVWRTRFVLNYKRLPYKTQFLAYPQIHDVLTAAGIAPTETATKRTVYTVPSIIDDVQGQPPVKLSNSAAIADYLEDKYPAPTIYPHGREAQLSYVAAVGRHVYSKIALITIPNAMRILDGADKDYYIATREQYTGIALNDMFPSEKQDTMWADVVKGLDELSAFADGLNSSEDWLFGDAAGPGYADFVLGAVMIWLKSAGPEGGWDKIKGLNGGRWERHYENLRRYMQVL